MMFDIFDLFLEKIGWPIIMLVVVLLILSAPFYIYAEWQDSKSPVITLKKSDWACTAIVKTQQTTYVQTGQVMSPITTDSKECTQWSLQP